MLLTVNPSRYHTLIEHGLYPLEELIERIHKITDSVVFKFSGTD